jgi:hypothetical protein
MYQGKIIQTYRRIGIVACSSLRLVDQIERYSALLSMPSLRVSRSQVLSAYKTMILKRQ